MNIIGEVEGMRCILVDDIVDSAGTLCNAAVALKEAGAASVSAYVTHGVLSGGAVARVSASPLECLVITDSIQATEAVRVVADGAPALHRAADGRGDGPHQRGAFGLQPVRLKTSLPGWVAPSGSNPTGTPGGRGSAKRMVRPRRCCWMKGDNHARS